MKTIVTGGAPVPASALPLITRLSKVLSDGFLGPATGAIDAKPVL